MQHLCRRPGNCDGRNHNQKTPHQRLDYRIQDLRRSHPLLFRRLIDYWWNLDYVMKINYLACVTPSQHRPSAQHSWLNRTSEWLRTVAHGDRNDFQVNSHKNRMGSFVCLRRDSPASQRTPVVVRWRIQSSNYWSEMGSLYKWHTGSNHGNIICKCPRIVLNMNKYMRCKANLSSWVAKSLNGNVIS